MLPVVMWVPISVPLWPIFIDETPTPQAAGFPVSSYTPEDISSVWQTIRTAYGTPNYNIRAAVFNIGKGVWKPFLDITPAEIKESLEVNVEAAFAFSREAIITFKRNEIEEPKGARGTLVFTGATASLRGNMTTSAFAAGKFGLRALSHSLAKEFSKENIHVRPCLYYVPIH